MPDAETLDSPTAAARPTVRPPEVRVDGEGRVRLSGAWDIRALETLAGDLQQRLATLPAQPKSGWDLTGIQRLDHIGALMLWRAWRGARPAQAQILAEHEPFFATLAAPRPDSADTPLPALLRTL
jgi:phospholipid/cholesterol/gamma-HCH transport system permease protein